MAVGKVNARGWVFEYYDGVSTYTQIGGLNSFSLENQGTETDTTTFASNGMDEQEVMSRGMSLKLNGFFLTDTGTGTRDGGQSLVETAAESVGSASLVQFRITRPDNKRRTFTGTVVLDPVGGKNNDKASWGATIKRSGAWAGAWA